MADTYPAYVETYEEQPRRRRGHRLLVAFVVFLVLVVGLLVVADRAAAAFAERKIGDQVSQQLSEQKVQSSPPDVTVGGFPFLTQVVAGRYDLIGIQLRDVHAAVKGDSVSLPQLDIDARDVTASIDTLRTGQGEVRAKTVQGTATITYDSVEQLADQPGVQFAEVGGKLKVTAPLKILGQKFTLDGTAKLAVVDGAVQIRFDELTAKELPQAPAAKELVTRFAKRISIDIPLPDLPFQLKVQQVRVLPEGLVITAKANDVPLNKGMS